MTQCGCAKKCCSHHIWICTNHGDIMSHVILHITGPLWGESVTSGFPLQKSSKCRGLVFVCCQLNELLNKQLTFPLFNMLWCWYNFTVMVSDDQRNSKNDFKDDSENYPISLQFYQFFSKFSVLSNFPAQQFDHPAVVGKIIKTLCILVGQFLIH